MVMGRVGQTCAVPLPRGTGEEVQSRSRNLHHASPELSSGLPGASGSSLLQPCSNRTASQTTLVRTFADERRALLFGSNSQRTRSAPSPLAFSG